MESKSVIGWWRIWIKMVGWYKVLNSIILLQYLEGITSSTQPTLLQTHKHCTQHKLHITIYINFKT